MSTSATEIEPRAVDVHVTEDALEVRLADGRELRVPLAWFPRLQAAPEAARQEWRLIGGGVGIHWGRSMRISPWLASWRVDDRVAAG